ncbi:alpha/beta hydrolase [Bizionia myxarmorum]|uniref:Alpha/beta hydrolase n=1 Tax=Bizionia myxarmorum TaxID=291186 RepID=A0A5D0R8H2_9FLAO|nr:alpha/beta hydrolase [Bizionia myxarmorum]TYB77181.1 alpha/beta hydrolase [Bizionia myxarmorum]
MNQDIVHVYFMPGMAANPSIFEHIKLPKHQFEIHWLEWLIPETDESLSNYALRLTKGIKHDKVALIGVSFGGIVVQEMSKHIPLVRLIIISSVKSKNELPKRLKFMRITKGYNLIPTSIINNIDFLAKYAFGETVKKRVELYKKYLSITDPKYLNWAIKEMVNWNQVKSAQNLIHIHGSDDHVFPYKYIQNCITVENGTHIMVLNKYRWFNKHLPKLILEGTDPTC